jgi:mRNA interferase RelE/StbE
VPPRGLFLAVAPAVTEFLTGPLLDNPQRVGKPFTRELDGCHSARRGAYRVTYRIDEAERMVHVVRFDHRAGVCRSDNAALEQRVLALDGTHRGHCFSRVVVHRGDALLPQFSGAGAIVAARS